MDELECNRMAMIPETINHQRFEVVNQYISVKFKLNSVPMNRRPPWEGQFGPIGHEYLQLCGLIVSAYWQATRSQVVWCY